MPSYVCYELDSGRIKCFGSASNEENCYIQMEDVLNDHVLLNVEANDRDHYIVDGTVTDRPMLDVGGEYSIAANGQEEISFALPEGTKIIYRGEEHDGGAEFGFTTDKVGIFIFDIVPPFPYRPEQVIITAE